MLLFSFNLTRPQRMTERNNANYTASRSSTENSQSIGMSDEELENFVDAFEHAERSAAKKLI